MLTALRYCKRPGAEIAESRTLSYSRYMRLDHFFVLTEVGAPAANQIAHLGLVEGSPNRHPGQGTANRRFFFSNMALELLYIQDAKEAKSGPGQRLRFTERISMRSASPFGFVMRSDVDSSDPPFTGWRYQPVYFDTGVSFLVADNSDCLEEPLCICLPDKAPPGSDQVKSEAPFTEITELRLHVPVVEISSALKALRRVEGIHIQLDSPHLLEIAFNHEAEGCRHDLRPRLPLVICW